METVTEEIPLYIQRIQKELLWVNENTNVKASYVKAGDKEYVLYEGIETSGLAKDLPEQTDVLALIPDGYPSSAIDMPALPVDSKLLSHVVGSSNLQNIVTVNGRDWRFLSFHPYANGGGPQWDSKELGFHDYYNQLYVWLHKLS